jgi:ribosome biogenesis protein Nip4
MSCRGALLDIIKKTLLEDETSVQEFIAEFKEEFMEMPYQDIAMPRSMNNMSKYKVGDGFLKGTPPQTRGAIQFNKLLAKHGLTKTWEAIKEGEKGKFLYLREPNSIGTDVISFSTSIPDEFDVEKYIDREKMFDKTVKDAAENIFKPLGWSSEKINTLEDFFG